MFDALTFLGDMIWGLVGLFRPAVTRQARQYRLMGAAAIVGWLGVWAIAAVQQEGGRLALFIAGTLVMAVAMFCGYARLAETRPRK